MGKDLGVFDELLDIILILLLNLNPHRFLHIGRCFDGSPGNLGFFLIITNLRAISTFP
jgi:hypothetical protein